MTDRDDPVPRSADPVSTPADRVSGPADPLASPVVPRDPAQVVPLVEPVDAPAQAPTPLPGRRRREPRPWKPLFGVLGFAVATLVVLLDIVAIVVASSGQFVLGTSLGLAAIAVSVLALAIGVLAIVADRGRTWGIAGAALGLVANPFLLLQLLRLVERV